MTREEREEELKIAHQMFDNRNLLTELRWQRDFFKNGYISKQEKLFNMWIFDECIKALEQEPCENVIEKYTKDDNKMTEERALEILTSEKLSAEGNTDFTDEEVDEIKVGDEVTSVNYEIRAVVTKINSMVRKAYLLYADGSTCEVTLNNGKYKKTGRHLPQIADVLKQIEGE